MNRARSFAISRGCQTRLEVANDGDGALIVLSRHQVEAASDDIYDYNWRTFAPTGRMEMATVSPTLLFFRPDGSCCTNEDLLTSEAVFEDFSIELYGPPRSSTAGAEEAESQTVTVSARTGLAKGEEHP